MRDDTQIVKVPRPGQDPLSIDVGSIYRAEVRINEVAFVNAQKAPELLAAFNLAFLDVCDVLLKLQLCVHKNRQAVEMRRSIVILDIAPKVLASKGLNSARSAGGSADQREAVVAADTEMNALQDNLAMAEAMLELMTNKKKSFEWAYTSVKKILGGDVNAQGLGRNNLAAGAPTPQYNKDGI